MDAQQTILITSIVVIQPTFPERNLSSELLPNTNDYRLVVDTSHANAVSVQSLTTKYSLYSYDVTKIIYDPELQSFYWHNVRSFIEATLLGYHGMIIFMLSSYIQLNNLNVTPFEILFTAVDQIFSCIQSSKYKYTQYFQVLFSHFALSIEDGNLIDLCSGLEAAAHLYRDVKGQQHTLIKTKLIDLNNLKQLIDRNHKQFKSELLHDSEGSHNLAQLGYHEFICMNVGFIGFSASFAPIGGELTFFIISTDYISSQITQEYPPNGNLLIHPTSKTVDALYSLLNNTLTKTDSDNKLETPLGSLLRDGVGGACKTCVISLLPDRFGLNTTENEASNEHTRLLNIAHQFSLVRNCPNRRIFAEKALMNVYMQEMSSNVSEVKSTDTVSSLEFGEDPIKQAAIALEQAVLEYNKRIQLTESYNEFELEAFNIADFTRTRSNTTEEQLSSDIVPLQIPKKNVTDNNNREVSNAASVHVFNATRIPVNSCDETNDISKLNEQIKNGVPRSDSVKSDNEEVIRATPDALEELISEEMSKVEQQNNNNNNNGNTESKAPLLTNIRISFMSEGNENPQEINIQLLNTSQTSSNFIHKEHNTKPLTQQTNLANKSFGNSENSNQFEYNPTGASDEFALEEIPIKSKHNSFEPRADTPPEIQSLNRPDNMRGYSISSHPSEAIGDNTDILQSTKTDTVTPSLDLNAPLLEQIQEKKGDAQIAEVVTFMLQDPMRGAPRCYQARGSKEVLQRRDLGSVFTGDSITAWIMNNVTGIQEWEEAETFGQWLLDQGELIHSEGSSVFAGAESLCYYARRSQPSTRNLSFEEIKQLMSEAKKVIQLANTEFYEPEKNDIVACRVAGTTANDDMILHQLMAEQLIVMKAGSRNVSIDNASLAGSGSNQSQQTTVGSKQQYDTSPNNGLSGSRGNGKKFLMNLSDSSIDKFGSSGASNHISDLFETRDVVFENAAISEDTQVTKVVERKEKVLIGNLTEKYVENIVQVYELHPLFENCRNGCRMGVLRNLVLNFGVNFEDEQKRTPIFYAAAGDQCRIGLELIRSHANINHIDKFKLSPLLVATQLGYLSFLGMLLGHVVDVTHFDKAGSNAYHLACKLEAIGCLQKLLRKAKPGVLDKLDDHGLSPLHYAIQNKYTGHIELLFKHQIDISVLNPKGLSYLSFAIYNNSACCIGPLLTNCPGLIGQANSDFSTALHVAAIQSTSECLQMLLSVRSLKRHVDIQQIDSKGRTALHVACKRGVDDSVRLLLESKAFVLTNDNSGISSLQYAIANSNLSQEVLDLLEATQINEMKGIIKLKEGRSKTCQIQ